MFLRSKVYNEFVFFVKKYGADPLKIAKLKWKYEGRVARLTVERWKNTALEATKGTWRDNIKRMVSG